MHRFIARLLPFVLLGCAPQSAPETLAAPAPAASPAVAPAAAATETAKPALWAVRDADTTIYLFGTIHVLKPGLRWFEGDVRAAFDASQELKLEMVLPPAGATQALAMRVGTTATGPTLPERLPPATRTLFVKTLADYGLPAGALDRFQPWFAANNLVILPLLRLGFALDSGVEQVLTRAATAAAKPVTGFETMEQQLGFFAGLSDPAQLEYLTGVLTDLPDVAPTVERMVVDWSQADPEALARVLNEDLDSNPELARVLLTDRNQRWADWIAERMRRPGTVFVAVGAGHLAGADSVQAKLAAQGVRATRLDR